MNRVLCRDANTAMDGGGRASAWLRAMNRRSHLNYDTIIPTVHITQGGNAYTSVE